MFQEDSREVCDLWLRKGGVSIHFPPHAEHPLPPTCRVRKTGGRIRKTYVLRKRHLPTLGIYQAFQQSSTARLPLFSVQALILLTETPILLQSEDEQSKTQKLAWLQKLGLAVFRN